MGKNESKEPEVVEVNQSTKINFFKKIWYSIAKPSKYEDMRDQGISSAIKYFFGILAILALILAIIASFVQVSIVKDAVSYLEENIPEIKFKDNVLSLENQEATILDDAKVKEYFGSTIIINPLIKKDQAISEYNKLTTKEYNVVVFLSNTYIVINDNYNPKSGNEDGIEVHKYEDESSKFIKDNSAEYGKEHVISYFNENTSYGYYIGTYFAYYFGSIGIGFIVYILLIAASLWLVTKFTKIKWEFKEAIMNTIYSSTLALIIYIAYMILSYFTKFAIPYFDIITIVLIYIYIFLQLYKERRNFIANKKTE